ncbi:unnamed protein product [Amoebophrya sp. A120]|nr:unnamed protein product [Amoebophrya sp. A120]|eukprot:GSA120T00012655001.1
MDGGCTPGLWQASTNAELPRGVVPQGLLFFATRQRRDPGAEVSRKCGDREAQARRGKCDRGGLRAVFGIRHSRRFGLRNPREHPGRCVARDECGCRCETNHRQVGGRQLHAGRCEDALASSS